MIMPFFMCVSPYREDEEEEARGWGPGMSAVQCPIGWERGGDE